MSDTWNDIQAVKNKQSSLREKLAKRKREREGLVADITGVTAAKQIKVEPVAGIVVKTEPGVLVKSESGSGIGSSTPSSGYGTSSSPVVKAEPGVAAIPQRHKSAPLDRKILELVERQLLNELSAVSLSLPITAQELEGIIGRTLHKDIPKNLIEELLQKFAAQQLISIKSEDEKGELKLIVELADHSKLYAVTNELDDVQKAEGSGKKKKEGVEADIGKSKVAKSAKDDTLESLLAMQSAKEKETKKMNEEILELLSVPTAKEQSLVEKFKSQSGSSAVKEFCQHGTKEECLKATKQCNKLHFKKIINQHTDESLGDCSFLNTCFHMDTCKYVHYEIDYPEQAPGAPKTDVVVKKSSDEATRLFPPQWVQCDLRKLDMKVLGKFAVIMADPPWDIHMDLPYGTMSDEEMMRLPLVDLQDEGYLFLWVTGRAMELGRECMKLWGYERIDEIIWVKTNQLQRIIRTGRTGHWINHGKEHCLVGVKGLPKNMNKGLDCDVLVAEVRATSHKPDDIYGIIERLSPGTRKVELFGRPHNVQPNWITLGNQLDGVRLLEPDVVKAFKARYPNGYNNT